MTLQDFVKGVRANMLQVGLPVAFVGTVAAAMYANYQVREEGYMRTDLGITEDMKNQRIEQLKTGAVDEANLISQALDNQSELIAEMQKAEAEKLTAQRESEAKQTVASDEYAQAKAQLSDANGKEAALNERNQLRGWLAENSLGPDCEAIASNGQLRSDGSCDISEPTKKVARDCAAQRDGLTLDPSVQAQARKYSALTQALEGGAYLASAGDRYKSYEAIKWQIRSGQIANESQTQEAKQLLQERAAEVKARLIAIGEANPSEKAVAAKQLREVSELNDRLTLGSDYKNPDKTMLPCEAADRSVASEGQSRNYNKESGLRRAPSSENPGYFDGGTVQ